MAGNRKARGINPIYKGIFLWTLGTSVMVVLSSVIVVYLL